MEAIPYTDYLFFSSDDGDTETLRELMKVLYSQGPKLVIAMLGEQGSLCFDGQTFHSLGLFPAPMWWIQGCGRQLHRWFPAWPGGRIAH